MKSKNGWKAGLFILILAVLIFRICVTGDILFSTDDNIGHMAQKKADLPGAFTGWWQDHVIVGHPAILLANWTNGLLWLLPLKIFVNWIHALDLGLGAFFLAWFLMRRGCRLPAALFGSFTAFWLGTNLTLTYAGHTGKYGVLMWASAALLCIDSTVRSRRWGWALVTGGVMGAMFLEQADLALFFSLVWGAYYLFRLLPDRSKASWFAAIPRVAVSMLVALLTATPALLGGARLADSGNKEGEQKSAQEQWAFATQWSWPPEESIAFVAPHYMGMRSGEQKAPYWGRLGRSEEWEETRQGFMNFKLESTYLGMIPVLMALFGLWAALRRGEMSASNRREAIFWGAAVVMTLLLSFGKHFFLYRLFYMLPVVGSIRNPNKFIQIFQIGVGVLSAFGLQSALTMSASEEGKKKLLNVGLWPAAAVAVLFLAMGLYGWGAASIRIQQYAGQGWPEAAARAIVAHKTGGLLHAGVMSALLAGFFIMLLKPGVAGGVKQARAAWVLVAVIAVDALLLARHYIQPLPESMIRENEVTRIIKQLNTDHQRVAMVSQNGFYNNWLTYLFPYHGIPALNITQMPRMPAEYQQFLRTVGRNPARYWHLCAVRFLLAPAQIVSQLQKDPNWKNRFEVRYAYNVAGGPGGDIKVIPHTREQPGQHVLLEIKDAMPRFALYDRAREAGDDEALNRLADSGNPLHPEVLVAPDGEAVALSSAHGIAGTVEMISYDASRIALRVNATRPSFLRLADKYDPDWTARVDGKPVIVRRCDYLFRGIPIDAGEHEVTWAYKPNLWFLWSQAMGLALALAGAGLLVIRRGHAAEASNS